jgi:two-component system nitrogen regulation response regulator GlnG
MSTLLVIDDEPAILESIRMALDGHDTTVVTAASAAEGLGKLAYCQPDVVMLDINLPDLSGLEVFRRIHERDPKIPTIFMTGEGTTGTAIEAMALGAYEYLLKPLRRDQVCEVVRGAFQTSRLMRVPAVVAEPQPTEESGDMLIGRCAAMQEVYKAIGRIAPKDVMVLILGESGTGKELVARAIYHYSRRSSQMFLAINCAAIPEALLESELFGHEKGAFTGAERKRIGKFEQCSGGTMFLDEIGDMPPLTQTKILRVLQEQRFERVGGNESIQTDVRLIAATNCDLESLVASDRFRKDLFYRLNVFTIRLPPLRERSSDLPLLVNHFLKRFGQEFGKEVRGLATETTDLLQRYAWPGNLRELQSVLKHTLLQATGPVLLPEFLPASFRASAKDIASSVPGSPTCTEWERFIQERLQSTSADLYAEWQALTDRCLLSQVLRHTGGNLSHAAKILGIHRVTLRTKIAALGIPLERANSVLA